MSLTVATIYKDHRQCRVCHTSHRVAPSTPRDNFGVHWLCPECYPATPGSVAKLTAELESERLTVIRLVEAKQAERNRNAHKGRN